MFRHTMGRRILRFAGLAALSLLASRSVASQAQGAGAEWPFYGGDAGGSRYSTLDQITRENVTKLEVAWTYRSGDYIAPDHGKRASAFEATPLVVDGVMYLSTPFGKVIALDPEAGTELWRYDPHVDIHRGYGDFASRGVALWRDGSRKKGALCATRVFVATIDARLIAVDAASGKPCADFGASGVIDLRSGLRNPPDYFAEYEETSPPAVIRGTVVVGSAVADNHRANAASGVVRAFDARTGKLRWSFDPVPQDSTDPAWSSWRGPKAHTTGAGNAWSIITTDSMRDLVFVPTGSASPDYFGGERLGDNHYANSVIALRASTGKVVWHFQVIHHDLWDYDVAASPALVTVKRDGREVPAVVQTSKIGHLFVLDRETGKPLFPVEERPVPASDVPGEEAARTQPTPVLPKPLVPQRITPDDAWGVTEADKKWCRDRISTLRNDGPFTPPSIGGSLIVPGNIGGSNWGGVAVDIVRALIIAPTNRLATVVRLIPRDRFADEEQHNTAGEISSQSGTAFGMWREFLLSPSRLPCTAPPWGALAAIDANTGLVRWEVPLGTIPWAPKEANLGATGSINLGGAIVTAGGLVFIAASFDSAIRAFDVETGKELWLGSLPAAGHATPMTFKGRSGRQYVVIAAGGYPDAGLPGGDYLVAFALGK